MNSIVETPDYIFVLGEDGTPKHMLHGCDRAKAESLAAGVEHPVDQASALRALAADVTALPGPIVFSFSHLGWYAEIVERPRVSFARYSVYLTPPGGQRYKTDINLHLKENAAEDAMREIERVVQERVNANPQYKLPPSDADFAAAAEE